MQKNFENYLANKNTNLPIKSVEAVLGMTAEGATVPFMARYRKEKTGNLDEVQIRKIIDLHDEFEALISRQAFILKEIESQGNLTEDLKKRITESHDLGELEELYRPYKKKKKTKATLAREAGLEPLSQWIWQIGHGELEDKTTIEEKAREFLNPEKKFATFEECLKGAQDILVEKLSNNQELRQEVRNELNENGQIITQKGKKYKPSSKYETYSEYKENVKALLNKKSSHRYLAIRRGWQEGELKLSIEGDQDKLLKLFEDETLSQPESHVAHFLKKVAQVALDIHVMPSITNEIHRLLKETADEHAIEVFSENLRQLLMASPFGSKCVLGVDPGLRTGCKVALVDPSGKYISNTVLDILGEKAHENAKKLFSELFSQIQVQAIAVGNGTAGRETESFLRKVLKELNSEVPIVLVNESGASVYSASEVAREEFPDLDLTIRGAISIARRLQDPLAELVKIDPKSIGVGQYQHDISPTKLKKGLDHVVESCVNEVGVDLNTASAYLLKYISGIGEGVAKNLIEYRSTKGLFKNREELLKVPHFSSKTFEQAAGFLRIPNSETLLDRTGVHPERYSAVREMVQEAKLSLSDVIGKDAKALLENRTKWAELLGEYTFDDIIKELKSPARDPRDAFKVFKFKEDIHEVKDLKEEMVCPGIVTNVTNFGAFVDIGVHQDGLVHLSELAHQFVDDPRKVVKPGDQVQVKVLKVDAEKNQISLSMKLSSAPTPKTKNFKSKKKSHFKGKPSDKKNFKKSAKGKSGKSNFKGKPRKPKQNFNNPFAALADVKIEK